MALKELQIDNLQVETSVDANGNEFYTPINSSVRVGDTIYYAIVDSYGVTSDAFLVGELKNIESSGYLEVETDDNLTVPVGAFILFSKRIQVNESSMKGYYADVTLENHSKKRAELFALSSDIVPSSK